MAYFNGNKDFILMSGDNDIQFINLKKNLVVTETAEAMDSVLAKATDDSVGSYYKYIGATTANYKKGAIYRLGKNDSNQIAFEEIYKEGSGSVALDPTFQQEDMAAESKAVGAVIDGIYESLNERNHDIAQNRTYIEALQKRCSDLETFDQSTFEGMQGHNNRIGELETHANMYEKIVDGVAERVKQLEIDGIQVITTEQNMDDVLAQPAQYSIYRYFMYLGETGKYTKGTVYELEEA